MSTEPTPLDDINARYHAAWTEYNRLRDDRRETIDAAVRLARSAAETAWDAQYAESLKAVSQLDKDLDAERQSALVANALANSTRNGKPAYLATYTRYGGKVSGFQVGVFEIMTPETKLAANCAPPAIGDEFVRLLKADGTPSLRFDTWVSLWSEMKPVVSKEYVK